MPGPKYCRRVEENYNTQVARNRLKLVLNTVNRCIRTWDEDLHNGVRAIELLLAEWQGEEPPEENPLPAFSDEFATSDLEIVREMHKTLKTVACYEKDKNDPVKRIRRLFFDSMRRRQAKRKEEAAKALEVPPRKKGGRVFLRHTDRAGDDSFLEPPSMNHRNWD